MSAVEDLSRRIFAYLADFPEAAKFVAEFPSLVASRTQTPRRLPVCKDLSKLVELPGPSTQALVDALEVGTDSLEWSQTYSASDFGPEFLQNYGWTELIGLRGPIASEKVACGFLLLGPGIEYPAHAHEAEELYLPLAGEALWMRGDEGFVRRPLGKPIAHPSWMPHAMRTLSQPMLALYLWRGGDLAAKSKILSR
jgi:hypothetical protein